MMAANSSHTVYTTCKGYRLQLFIAKFKPVVFKSLDIIEAKIIIINGIASDKINNLYIWATVFS